MAMLHATQDKKHSDCMTVGLCDCECDFHVVPELKFKTCTPIVEDIGHHQASTGT